MVATESAATPKQYLSLSRLASRLGVTPRKVMKLATDTGVQPAVFLDDAFYYDEAGAARIADELKAEQEQEAA